LFLKKVNIVENNFTYEINTLTNAGDFLLSFFTLSDFLKIKCTSTIIKNFTDEPIITRDSTFNNDIGSVTDLTDIESELTSVIHG